MADFAIVPRYVRANPDVRTAVPLRPAPRVPAGHTSLAASAAPSRRGILGALAFMPAIAAVATVGFAHSEATADAWDAADRRFKEARARLSAASEANDAALGRYYATRDSLPKEPNGVEIRKGDTIETAYARDKALRETARRADAECQRACGVAASEDVLEAACDADEQALQALFATAAPDLNAAIKKLEMINDGDGDGLHHVLADLRRLSQEGC